MQALDTLTCTNPAEWESWLADNHAQSPGIWLLIAKKGSTKPLITIGEALDVALCYGWIDSQRKGYDAHTYLQRYSPRGRKSPWSRLNVERVEALTEAGRMRPAGLAQVAAAQADGRWAVAYEPQRKAGLPDDVASALGENARAKTAFERLDKSGQYALILPLLKATTPEIRAARLKKAIAKLADQ
ncbi:YdeI/OmpD-associated family protein [Pararhizobium sp. LjRoot238]|uniref:YdeI/OmpD-associated family protein n=1 Tax=Pararhizobium sp. LjRoot238 TaxID=3342293 RepID=UPI003ECC2739